MSNREIAISEVMPRSVPLAPVSMADGIVHMIERVARDPSIEIARLKECMDLFERVKAREAEQHFNASLVEVQAKLRQVSADASNPQTKSRYASYAALDRAVRPVFAEHGFALTFDTGEGAPDLHVRVICNLLHKDGHSKRYHIDMPADGKGAKGGDVMTRTHATASAVSYGRRYLLNMIGNIAIGDDDDGNAATASGRAVSEPQFSQLMKLMDEVGVDKAKFCNFFQIDGVALLPAAKFQQALSMCNAKKAKKARG